MKAREAVASVRKHGLVLESAHVAGVPTLVDAIAGEPIRGNWWGHPKGRQIFRVLNQVRDSDEIVALRLVNGKLTLAHRRVWPALAALAADIGRSRLAAITEEHTPSGRHETTVTPFPKWVPKDVLAEADRVDLDEARAICGPALR